MSGGLFDGMTTSRVAALAAMVMSAPMVAAFAPSGVPMGLQQRAGAISRAASAIPTLRTPASRCTLRMQEEVAGVSEVSDQEQRSLDKTRTNKRPRSDNKNKKPLTDYTVGEMTKGKVVSIMPYGAFVDVGTTTDGLVHVSQIADEFVSDIESVVKVGQEVECRIVSVDTDNNKISLSMRSENAKPAGGGGGGGRGKRAELPEEFKNFDDQKFIPGKVRGHPAARDPRRPPAWIRASPSNSVSRRRAMRSSRAAPIAQPPASQHLGNALGDSRQCPVACKPRRCLCQSRFFCYTAALCL
jgi:predicted RNA-binding protein with RPS1 domain